MIKMRLGNLVNVSLLHLITEVESKVKPLKMSAQTFLFVIYLKTVSSQKVFHIGSNLSINGPKTIVSIFSLGAQGSDLAHFLGDWSQSEKLSEPLTRTNNHEKMIFKR